MTDLDVMMNWFAPDVETRETYCARCGTHVTADRHATKILYYANRAGGSIAF